MTKKLATLDFRRASAKVIQPSERVYTLYSLLHQMVQELEMI